MNRPAFAETKGPRPETCLFFLLLAAAVVTPGGALHPQTRVELPGQDEEISLEVEEVYRVGSLAGEEWETFARITGVAFDQEGNLYLLDADNFRVVKVGLDGEFLAELGGEGGGPGEFGMPLALSVTKEGQVRVFDVGYGGFTIFSSDGVYETSVPMAPGDMFFPSGALLSHPDGRILSPGGAVVGLRRTPDGRVEFPETLPVHLFSLAEEVGVDTIYKAWNPAIAEGKPDLTTTEGGGIQIQAPPMRAFDPEVLGGVLPDGRIVVADSTTYDIKVVTVEGEIQQLFHRPLSPRAVTRRDREAERERRLAEMESSGGPRIMMRTDQGATSTIASSQAKAMMEARIETMVFAGEIPVLADLGVDWEGRLWVKRTGADVGDEGPLDLVDGNGVYLGTVSPDEGRIPDAFGPGGLTAVIEEDELGVPTVVVRRVSFR